MLYKYGFIQNYSLILNVVLPQKVSFTLLKYILSADHVVSHWRRYKTNQVWEILRDEVNKKHFHNNGMNFIYPGICKRFFNFVNWNGEKKQKKKKKSEKQPLPKLSDAFHLGFSKIV